MSMIKKSEKEEFSFIKKIGFVPMPFDLLLYHVLYAVYLLPIHEEPLHDQQVLQDMFAIYNAILGKTNVRKNCSVIPPIKEV